MASSTPRVVLLVVSVFGCRAADNPHQILVRIAQNVAAQLAKSSNYTCVQTIDRTYFESKRPALIGCAVSVDAKDREPYLHDRLRLDIAVSEGREIYAWHAAKRFASSSVAEVVRSGPISSGNFIGYLDNIFLQPGVLFYYSGESQESGLAIYKFKYTVPLDKSGYHVQTGNGNPIVAFHGSFTANAADYQMESLQVIADMPPNHPDLCTVETDVAYQLVNISGRPSLIPANFVLSTTTPSHISTVSRSEYAQCREFRGESTLLFYANDTSALASAEDRSAPAQWLPAGLVLRVRLRTSVDDRTSFTGDPVEGVLLDPVLVPGTDTVLPKNAVLDGIITRLEHHYQPWNHYLVDIQFEHLTYAKHSFRLNALPQTPKKSFQELEDVYRSPLPAWVFDEVQTGVFAIGSSHVHFDRRFVGIWKTSSPPEAK